MNNRVERSFLRFPFLLLLYSFLISSLCASFLSLFFFFVRFEGRCQRNGGPRVEHYWETKWPTFRSLHFTLSNFYRQYYTVFYRTDGYLRCTFTLRWAFTISLSVRRIGNDMTNIIGSPICYSHRLFFF
jgi:hypothetical protein